MFPASYFGPRMFAPRYFAKVGAAPLAGEGGATNLLLMGAG
jgi:hypothetical protein